MWQHLMRVSVLLTFAGALALAAGCTNVCDDYCQATVDKIADLGCMSSEWGTTWEDQGYADEEDYLQHCMDDFDAQYSDAREESDAAAQEIRANCSDKLEETDAASNCDDLAAAGY